MATDFIDLQRATYTDLADKYAVLGELYDKKLWHQLTLALLEFVHSPASHRGDNLLQLYEKFIVNVETRVDQLKFVQILAAISTQYYPTRPYAVPELERAEAHLSSFVAKQARLGPAAFLVLQMEALSLKLKRAAALSASPATAPAGAALLDECKKEMTAGKDALEALPDGTEPVVTATVHRVAAEYYKMRGPANLFYDSALLYLGHTPLEALSPELREGLAFDVATSALVGEGIFNFGEVNAHAVLASLNGTPRAWLIDLLRVFQTGDIDGFDRVTAAHAGAMNAVPALTGHAAVVKEKITLLRLMELAAARPAHARSISFADIAAACHVPVDGVEHLALRSLSLGLLKGTIDQVDEFFHVSYVKPRVLSLEQIATLKGGIDGWRDRAKESLRFLEEHSAELLDTKHVA